MREDIMGTTAHRPRSTRPYHKIGILQQAKQSWPSNMTSLERKKETPLRPGHLYRLPQMPVFAACPRSLEQADQT